MNKHKWINKLILAFMASLFLFASLLSGCAQNGAGDTSQEEIATVSFTFTVVYADGSEDTFELESSATSLRTVLEDEGLISGSESEYGLYVTEVNGVIADYSVDQAFWSLYVNDEMSMYGVDTIVPEENATYSFVYTIG